MRSDDAPYEFSEGVPITPIAPGTAVMVAGPSLSRAEKLARSMAAAGNGVGEGSLFISTGMTCESLLEECRGFYPSLDVEYVGVIDCSGQDIGETESDVEVKYVSTQSDLTGIGMKFSALYESLYADAVGGRVRTSLVSLSSLSMYVDLRKLFRFTQTVSGRIQSADGLGVFAVDPSIHDDKTVNTLGQTVDGRIEVRDAEDNDDVDGELRVRGLPDQPSDWEPFSLPEP